MHDGSHRGAFFVVLRSTVRAGICWAMVVRRGPVMIRFLLPLSQLTIFVGVETSTGRNRVLQAGAAWGSIQNRRAGVSVL